MKKVIRLTESDLTRIVKRVINEETEGIDNFIDIVDKQYNINDELKTVIFL